MKGYAEKWLGLNKPEHIKARSETCPSAGGAITSECISLSNQLVWWPVDPQYRMLATVAAVQSPGRRQYKACLFARLDGLVLPRLGAAITADTAVVADLQTGQQKVGSSILLQLSTVASRETNLSFPELWKKD